MEKIINNLEDIYNIKVGDLSYDKVVINLNKILLESGCLDHIFKQVLWNLNLNGVCEVNHNCSNNQLHSVNAINQWQVLYCIKTRLASDIVFLSRTTTCIKFKKVKESYINSGLSFGVVFSGSDSEIPQLTNQIESILFSCIDNYEVLICGPTLSKYKEQEILAPFSGKNVMYTTFNFSNDDEIPISKKKNHLLSQSRFNLCIIAHTRIMFPNDFYNQVIDKKVDICTTRIRNEIGSDYISFVLTGSYNLLEKNTYKPISGNLLISNFYLLMRNRVSYCDGGLLIINKNNLKSISFNNCLSWGEAEDLDLACNAYNNGLLVDWHPEICCISRTNKIKKSFYHKYKWIGSIKIALIKIGFF
ncbi:hypothetical protein [Vibrio splendidus]|uniref:hypothetical protein n=1 Tax=Vibrio splendidus TaxID=29497 RepID=UPI000C8243E1|nr:hypothetical protein [Vibrio splendidus]PMI31372.1 hypothetical protein BCU48_00005 [Vibrio splendidus]